MPRLRPQHAAATFVLPLIFSLGDTSVGQRLQGPSSWAAFVSGGSLGTQRRSRLWRPALCSHRVAGRAGLLSPALLQTCRLLASCVTCLLGLRRVPWHGEEGACTVSLKQVEGMISVLPPAPPHPPTSSSSSHQLFPVLPPAPLRPPTSFSLPSRVPLKAYWIRERCSRSNACRRHRWSSLLKKESGEGTTFHQSMTKLHVGAWAHAVCIKITENTDGRRACQELPKILGTKASFASDWWWDRRKIPPSPHVLHCQMKETTLHLKGPQDWNVEIL